MIEAISFSVKLCFILFHLGALVRNIKIFVKSFFFSVSWYCIFVATGIFSVTLEDSKQQADEFGLEGKDRTKFLKEWWKMEDAKLEKECFKMEAEQKHLESAEEKQLEREMEEKRFKELKAK